MKKQKEQIKIYTDFFKKNQKNESNKLIGAEFEHFVVDKMSSKSISYDQENGVKDLLKEISSDFDWQRNYEGIHLFSLKKNGSTITLEPGAQIELSLKPAKTIESLEKEYLNLMRDIVGSANKFNYNILPIGYHPKTKIDELSRIPKKRYKYMHDYLGKQGKYAHNMMKGTSSVQVSIDYFNEKDFSDKFKVAYLLAPLFTTLLDNTPIFEGKKNYSRNSRMTIWQNCDDKRCGLIPGILDNNTFSYSNYADYILNLSPIFLLDEKGNAYKSEEILKSNFDPNEWNYKQFYHTLSMIFPDVRAKEYIELRFLDALPYPLNFAFVSVIEELFYNKSNLNYLLKNYADKLSDKDYKDVYKSIQKNGLDALFGDFTLRKLKDEVIELLEKSGKKNKPLVNPLIDLFKKEKSLREVILDSKDSNFYSSINNMALNNIWRTKKCVNHCC